MGSRSSYFLLFQETDFNKNAVRLRLSFYSYKSAWPTSISDDIYVPFPVNHNIYTPARFCISDQGATLYLVFENRDHDIYHKVTIVSRRRLGLGSPKRMEITDALIKQQYVRAYPIVIISQLPLPGPLGRIIDDYRGHLHWMR